MTDPGEQAPIVVGVDGSESAQDALDWAAAEASTMLRPLHIVHGFIWPLMNVDVGPSSIGPADGGLQAQAERLLADAETRTKTAAPDVNVTCELVVGDAIPALLRQAHDAELLVVGSLGLGGFLGLLVGQWASPWQPMLDARSWWSTLAQRASPRQQLEGSWSVRTARNCRHRRSHSPSGPQPAARPVSPSCRPGNLPCRPTRGCWWGSTGSPVLSAGGSSQPSRPTGKHSPGSTSRSNWSATNTITPARTLIEESAGADLVVVGSRGRGGFAGLPLGSVSQSVLEHATCPVAVVRPHSDEPRRERRDAA